MSLLPEADSRKDFLSFKKISSLLKRSESLLRLRDSITLSSRGSSTLFGLETNSNTAFGVRLEHRQCDSLSFFVLRVVPVDTVV